MQFRIFFVTNLLGLIKSCPKGHMQPLGFHTLPMVDVPVLHKVPSPTDFYENYVKPDKPLIMKNCLENGKVPAYNLWNDDYLMKHFGNEQVDFEMKKKEDRKGQSGTSTFSEFLFRYKSEEIYMINDLSNQMKEDISIPSSLSCGGFQHLLDVPVMWLNSGNTKSVLHHDMEDNINCLLDGKKDIVLVDKKHKDLIESDGFDGKGGYSNVNVDAVDMIKFPELSKVPWYQVNLTKGDCLFIPHHWYHYVYSHPGRNFAVNTWFHHLRWFNHTDCEDMNLNHSSFMPLSHFPKESKSEKRRHQFFDYFEDREIVTREEFRNVLEAFIDADKMLKIFDSIDRNGDNKLSWQEMYMFNDDQFFTKFEKTEKILEIMEHESELIGEQHNESEGNSKNDVATDKSGRRKNDEL